uniref:RGS domain-containing protein n=1 Tax=Cyprinus carpio TaxID=7962 RepID=A0A8C1UYC8_CYPCA
QLFCQNRFDPYRAQRMAQLLYASYLSSGAQMSVGLSEEDRRAVLLRLSPPFEDLFDRAEEHALRVLLEPWTLLSEKLRDAPHTVRVTITHSTLLWTVKNFSREVTAAAPAEGSRAPGLWAKVPREFRGVRLDSLLRNRMELQHFLSFLEENSASEASRSLLLQMCGGWQRLQHESVSLSVLTELQSLLHSRLETRWLPLFLSNAQFITRQQQKVRKPPHDHPQHFSSSVSGGLMSSSQESVALRRALLNPVTRLQFQKFLSVRDDLLENDLLFWLEVQRYKDLCHSRCDDVTLQRKVSIIISCFISCSVPPALQIHVPPDAAQRVMSQQRALGPYVFRETQACVFEELLKHWPDFVALRSAVGEDELQRVLERETRSSR